MAGTAGSEKAQILARVESEMDGAGDGCVYFVQVGNCGPIKIGYTTWPRLRARMAALQTASPWPLSLRTAVPGTRRLERLLHQMYGTSRMAGEWFQATPGLAQLAKGEAEPNGI